MFTVRIDSSTTFDSLLEESTVAHTNPNIGRNIRFQTPALEGEIVVEAVRLKVKSESSIPQALKRRGLRHASPIELMTCGTRHYEQLRAELGAYWTLLAFSEVKTFSRGERCVFMVGANFLDEYMADPTHKPSSFNLFWPIADPMWIDSVYFLCART